MDLEIQFHLATHKDIEKISYVHKRAFKNDHFSALFSVIMLREYLTLLIELNSFSLVAKRGETIVGYIIAGDKTDESLKIFIRKNRLKMLLILFSHPRFLIEKINEVLLRSFGKKKKSAFSMRLFLIAVDPQSVVREDGTRLLEYFEHTLKKNKIYYYGLSVRKKNEKAISFYERNGFAREFENGKSICYYKSLI
ncbi:MAG: hypothetical protein A2057_06610 [Ignavibacteria bacterium GWA2_35_9]|nr:MAG: hypothetical protein A2057_06610 [Ignavibacteria bacterium GWA2_35_9]OGU48538.1 MAG: hypothetical protein A2080_07975 [Ignavibacteria bacterium GWC2_36_12]